MNNKLTKGDAFQPVPNRKYRRAMEAIERRTNRAKKRLLVPSTSAVVTGLKFVDGTATVTLRSDE